MRNPFHLSYTKHLRSLRTCLPRDQSKAKRVKGRLSLPASFDFGVSAEKCLDKPTEICKTSPAIVLKFIRLRMKLLLDLFPYFPNLKIVHLVRDPRGILNSRMNIKKNEQSDKNENLNVSSLCKRLNENLSVSKFLYRHSPNKIKILRYEDLAEKTVATSSELMSFTGLNLTSNMVDFLKRMTSSSRDTCTYCTQRKNSTQTASKWRHEMTLKKSINIFNACKDSMNVLGYLNITSYSEMKNARFKSRTRQNVAGTLENDNRF